MIDAAAEAAGKIDGTVSEALQKIPSMLTRNEDEAFLELAHSSDDSHQVERVGVEDRCLPVFLIAVHSWLRDPVNPNSVIRSCLQSGGAVQLTAAIGGALVGACCGEAGLPARLVNGLLEVDELRKDADQLYDRQQLERRRRSI